jgi:hypothetical protein
MVEIKDVDKKRAAAYLGYRDWDDANDYRLTGREDEIVQKTALAFASHRHETWEPLLSVLQITLATLERLKIDAFAANTSLPSMQEKIRQVLIDHGIETK